MNIKNITVIIGASSDIGIALIKALPDNSTIIAHYNQSESSLMELKASSIKKIIPVQADLSSENEVLTFISTVKENYGTPNDIVLLAAPKFRNIRFKDCNWSQLESEINVSLKSTILILHSFMPLMARNGGGKVVFMLSGVTINVPPKALVPYTTVKYALLGLMRSLASEYSDKGINVNAVSPSMIRTKFLSEVNPKIVELASEGHPKKRIAEVEDVVGVLLLLLNRQSDYISGVNIPVTGGANF